MVYGRRFGERELRFEISGGLIDGALVMRDLETDSYWSIMQAEAIGGALKGEQLAERPVAPKARPAMTGQACLGREVSAGESIPVQVTGQGRQAQPALLLLILLCFAAPAAARRDKLALHHTRLDLPGAPSAIVSADLDGDGVRDLAVVVAYREWNQVAIEEHAEMDDVEGLVEVLTIIPESDESYATLADNLAASIYRQGELANDVQDYRAAADHFLRIRSSAPTSTRFCSSAP